MERAEKPYRRVADQDHGPRKCFFERYVRIGEIIVVEHEETEAESEFNTSAKHVFLLEVLYDQLDRIVVQPRLRLILVPHAHVSSLAQRGVHVTRQDEGGRVFAVKRVQCGRIGVERGVVHEYDGVVAFLCVRDEVALQLLPVGRCNVAKVGHDAAGSCVGEKARELQGLSVASTPMKQ